ncbi:MAG: hypothetical protein ACK5OP_10175 [Sphingobacteriales bacterium]|jgi:hypothetical protein
MIKNNFYPLRTIVGASIPIKDIIPYPKVGGPLMIATRKHAEIQDAVNDEIYAKYLPDIIKDGVRYHPVEGMDTMPISDSNSLPFNDANASGFLDLFKDPSDIPFPLSESVVSIYGFPEDDFQEMKINPFSRQAWTPDSHMHSGTDRSYSFIILLEKKVLVGGICFNGYPYISSRIEHTVEGMTIGNFGLPREIRLTPLPSFEGKSLEELTGFHRSQFIDAEYAYTRQEILSHSGLNYLTIDPIKTNVFLLTITDLPFIPKIINLDTHKENLQGPLHIEGFKGFAIPYLWFFEYKEQTKRTARLHSGILGVKPIYPHAPKINGDSTAEDILRRAFPEWEYFFIQKQAKQPKYTKEEILENIAFQSAMLENDPGNQQLIENIAAYRLMLEEAIGFENPEGVYWVYTAHSALGQRRQINFPYHNLSLPQELSELPSSEKKKMLTECFVSDLLQPGEKLTIYLQQGEEMDRCIAGLKALFLLLPEDPSLERIAEIWANFNGLNITNNQMSAVDRNLLEDILAIYLTLPTEINFCERFGVRIYEIDPAEGVSPASVDLNSKYASLLASITVEEFQDVIFSQFLKGIPFRRISNSKYFALEFTNTGLEPGQLALYSLQLIRSAHVSIQPRPAKNQQVKAMHYRIIGPELADDFSKLGNEGFNFCIDRVSAGQTKDILYSAMSLLDLLHTGGARLHQNVRRRAIEFEMSENFRDSKQKDEKYKIKKFIGDNLSGINFENREIDNQNIAWRTVESGKDVNWTLEKGDPNFEEFETYSGMETRTRTEQVSSLLDPTFDQIQKLRDQLQILVGNLAGGRLVEFDTASNKIFKNKLQGGTYSGIWKPFEKFGFNQNNLPLLPGYQTLNIPPYFLEIVDNVNLLLNSLQVDLGTDLSALTNLNSALNIRSVAIDNLISKLALVNGVSMGINGGGGLGLSEVGALALAAVIGAPSPVIPSLSGGASFSISSNLTTALRSSTNGAAGTVTQSGQDLKYSINRTKQEGYDNNLSHSEMNDAEQKRIVTRRELLGRDTERVRGAEVLWQDEIQDIITGSIPLNFTLPASATKMNFRTVDDSLRVRFNSGFSTSIQVDFWFELTEETIKDDN